jgi:hypothetical protein
MIGVLLLIELEWCTQALMWTGVALETPFNLTLVNALDLHELPLMLFEREVKPLFGISLSPLQTK